MLRSWIDRLQRASPPLPLAGLVFGRERIGFALLRREGDALSVMQARETILDRPLDPADRSSVQPVAQVMKTLTAEIAGRYLPLHVSLADSLCRMTVLELESVPADRAGQRSLAAFRLEREVGHPPASVNCQSLGQDDGKSLLLAASLDDDWAGYLGDILTQAGLVPWSLGTNLLCQFNRFHERLTTNDRGGALLALSPDAWSVLIWDAQGRPRVIRSRVRHPGADDYESVAGELERLILAYVHGAPQREIATIHVLADNPAMAQILDRRLKTPSRRINPHEGCRWEGVAVPPPGSIASMALAAALTQA